MERVAAEVPALKPESTSLGELCAGILSAHAEAIRGGANAVQMRINPALLALAAAYRRAQADPQFKCPTPLHAAIEAVITLIPPAPRPSWADRADHDTDVCGRALRPGS